MNQTTNLQIINEQLKLKPLATSEQYDRAVSACRNIFLQKTADYGTSWRVYRPISVADQIYIKAKRIRTIQDHKTQKIADGICSEFQGILNYAIIGLIQLKINQEDPEQLPLPDTTLHYNQVIQEAKLLMLDKNHDYGEAWREMSQESFVDLILAKILRIRQIIANDGKTIISEGIAANFYDIINYAVFAIILMEVGKHSK